MTTYYEPNYSGLRFIIQLKNEVIESHISELRSFYLDFSEEMLELSDPNVFSTLRRTNNVKDITITDLWTLNVDIFSGLKHLTSLYLVSDERFNYYFGGRNPSIITIEKSVKALTHLKSLSLMNFDLSHISEDFFSFDKLEYLNLAKSKVVIGVNTLKKLFNLKTMILDDSIISGLKRTSFECLLNLESLYLRNFETLEQLDIDVFNGIVNLKELYISIQHVFHNNRVLFGIFGSIKKLKKLKLSNTGNFFCKIYLDLKLIV
jgi:hypothetical protein